MKRFSIHYQLQGTVEIEAETKEEAYAKVYDRCGVTDDELYENLHPNALVIMLIKETSQ